MLPSLADIDVSALSEHARWVFHEIAVPIAVDDLDYRQISERLSIPTRAVSRHLDELAREILNQTGAARD